MLPAMPPIFYSILRGAPVLLSTASVTFSFSQYLFLRPYLDLPGGSDDGPAADRSQVRAILQRYIRREFPDGLATILTLYPLTWATAAANLTIGTHGLRRPGRPSPSPSPLLLLGRSTSWYLYAAGLAFSVSHLLWAPRAKGLMEAIAGLQAPSAQLADSRDGGKTEDGIRREDDSLALLKTWLDLHVVRSFLADVPGWLCFTAGFLLHRPI